MVVCAHSHSPRKESPISTSAKPATHSTALVESCEPKIMWSRCATDASIASSSKSCGRPSVFRSVRFTSNLVIVDLSRRSKSPISEGSMPSSLCHIFAKRISSFDNFRQGLRCGKCLLARRFGRALAMSRRAAGQGRAKTGERAN